MNTNKILDISVFALVIFMFCIGFMMNMKMMFYGNINDGMEAVSWVIMLYSSIFCVILMGEHYFESRKFITTEAIP